MKNSGYKGEIKGEIGERSSSKELLWFEHLVAIGQEC